MAFTSKIANIIKQGASSYVSNNLTSSLTNVLNQQGQATKVAAKLLNKSPLEIESLSPTTHMKENPYQYGTVYFPQECSNLGDGHYVIFDVVMHKASKFKTQTFNNGKLMESGDNLVGENTNQTNRIKNIKTTGVANKSRLRGVSSGLNERTPTHNYISDSIILYTPAASLKFSYSANYEGIDTGLAGLLGTNMSAAMESEDFISGLKAAGKGMKDAVQVLGRKAIFGAASLIPGLEQAEAAFDKAKGQAVNPFSELTFKSVPFRSFDFPFEFAPKNEKEKDSMHKIIQLFKFHMLPEYQSSTKGYFNSPSEFQVTYMYRENENTYIPRISRVVLTSMAVDYAPDGVVTTFKPDNGGASPVITNVSLTFQETEIMTKETIAKGY